jgi:adenine phosphoribosyltransferase
MAFDVEIDLKKKIRDVPDFPKKGIVFKDITTLLQDSEAFQLSINLLSKKHQNEKIDKVVGIEARGFIFGAALAYALNSGFVIIRKPGKLPYHSIKQTYELEYGTDEIEIHEDAIKSGERILLVDDLLATGGTMAAAAELLAKLGGEIIGISFLIELTFLHGREKLKSYDIHSLLKY